MRFLIKDEKNHCLEFKQTLYNSENALRKIIVDLIKIKQPAELLFTQQILVVFFSKYIV